MGGEVQRATKLKPASRTLLVCACERMISACNVCVRERGRVWKCRLFFFFVLRETVETREEELRG